VASVSLIVVAVGAAYERYADDLFMSADDHFNPSEDIDYHLLPARSGWPDATLYRYHILLEHADEIMSDYVFMIDADMLIVAHVGQEILAPMAATRHPGYVGRPRRELPYERRRESEAFVPAEKGDTYYAGGFVGGERERLLVFARDMATQIDVDDGRGILAQWHDESHLNAILARNPPEVALSPSYCFPDDSSWYETMWPDAYERKIVALDKPRAVRGYR
jgi:histo-blood group ABO system transferase